MPVTASPPTHTVLPERPLPTHPQPVEGAACAACPHRVADHDPIGLRFCRATVDSARHRGCVCRPA
jgi:hypothetical protein